MWFFSQFFPHPSAKYTAPCSFCCQTFIHFSPAVDCNFIAAMIFKKMRYSCLLLLHRRYLSYKVNFIRQFNVYSCTTLWRIHSTIAILFKKLNSVSVILRLRLDFPTHSFKEFSKLERNMPPGKVILIFGVIVACKYRKLLNVFKINNFQLITLKNFTL